MANIYVVANQKGGVGKTTTTVNLSAVLATMDKRVLVVDADPQSNASSSLGVELDNDKASLYDALINNVPIQSVINPTYRENLHVIPAKPELAAAEVELIKQISRETLLTRALTPVLADYDFIFIDTPPSLGQLTINALTLANQGVLIPVQCEYLALEGMSQLMSTIQLVQSHINPNLRVAGVILTMFDARTNLANDVVSEIRQHFPTETFETVIPRNVRLGEAPSYGEDIMAYAPQSAGAKAYQKLAKEVLGRVT